MLGNGRETAGLGEVELCQYLKVSLHTIQEDHFGPELFKLGLELGQHQFALRTFRTQTVFYRSHWKLRMSFVYTISVMKWPANLCFSSLAVSAFGRNFSFSLDSAFQ